MLSLIYIIICLGIVAACIKPLGNYMAAVYDDKDVWLERPLGGIERAIYAVCGVKRSQEMSWRGYAVVVLALGFLGIMLLFAIFMLQDHLPFNPQNFPGLSADLAFNASISFATNTNWQSYGGESTLSYFSQMAGCAVQNFLSAATGMTVAVALFRALARKQTSALGNPYVDIVRSILYILLPLSLVFACVLVTQGVIQNISPYTAYHALEGADGLIAQGPVASQEAIKMLGSNGGGFFNANGAHPFENPTPLSNLLELIAILLLPAAFAYTFGAMVGDRRQGWVLIAAMTAVFIPLLLLGIVSEKAPSPRFDAAIVDQSSGNIEGKETRFGITSSALWAAATAATSNGSGNASLDSFSPYGGLVPLLLIQLGEVIFGGVGSGVYGMLMFVMLTVFIGGLMVGRTPEYLGKKLGPYEIKMASLVILFPAALVLMGTAIAVCTEVGRTAIFNGRAQGFTEILYAFSSAANNNGSSFAGLNSNIPFYNIALGVAMFIGRYWIIVAVLAIAGGLARKNTVPVSAGTLPTHSILFTAMLVGVVIMIGVLTFVPALALGPVAEHMYLAKDVHDR